MGPGPSGLAHRVLGDVHLLPGRELRHSRRRQRPGVPAPRERDCPERGGHRQAVRQRLDALRHDPYQRREDVQVVEQLLHHPRRAREVPPGGGALPAGGQPLPQRDQLLGRQPARCQGRTGALLPRLARLATGGGQGWRSVCRAFQRGDERRLRHPRSLRRAVRPGARDQPPARQRPGGCCRPGWPPARAG
ncbi:hypothetical protein D3C79_735390 [compost metagenome]